MALRVAELQTSSFVLCPARWWQILTMCSLAVPWDQF